MELIRLPERLPDDNAHRVAGWVLDRSGVLGRRSESCPASPRRPHDARDGQGKAKERPGGGEEGAIGRRGGRRRSAVEGGECKGVEKRAGTAADSQDDAICEKDRVKVLAEALALCCAEKMLYFKEAERARGECRALRSTVAASKRCIAALHADISDHEGGELVRSLLQSIDRVEAVWAGVDSDVFLPVGVAAGKCGREVAESEAIERMTAGWEDAVRRACGKIPPQDWEEQMARMKGEVEACNAAVQDLVVANDRAQESLQAALEEACREKEARERGDRALEREKAAREKEAASRRERELQLRHLINLSRSMESAKDKAVASLEEAEEKVDELRARTAGLERTIGMLEGQCVAYELALRLEQQCRSKVKGIATTKQGNAKPHDNARVGHDRKAAARHIPAQPTGKGKAPNWLSKSAVPAQGVDKENAPGQCVGYDCRGVSLSLAATREKFPLAQCAGARSAPSSPVTFSPGKEAVTSTRPRGVGSKADSRPTAVRARGLWLSPKAAGQRGEGSDRGREVKAL